MAQKYEYKIVRVKATKKSVGLNSEEKPSGDDAYEHVIHQYAADGWRLCNIWSPCGWMWVFTWLDMVFEREVS